MLNRRMGASLAALGATALLLAACGGSSSSTASSAAPAASTAASAEAAAGVGASAALLPQEYKDKGVVNVASDIPYPPMEILADDGTVSGLDYDLSQALGQQLGVKFSFNKQAWDSIIPSLQSGNHDIIMSGMNDTVERQQTLDFVDYFLGGFSILVAKGNPDGITSLKDLCGKTVAEETEVAQIDLIKAVAKECPAGQTIEILELPSDSDAQNAVRAGKASADVLDAAVAGYSAATAPDLFEVVVDPNEPNGVEPVYTGIGVLKEDSGLTAALQAAMQELIDNGTYMEIMNKYGLGQYAVTEAVINGTKA
ncbi:MAG: ABC transporter substrate-binding protein [Actinomycetes bacterium]